MPRASFRLFRTGLIGSLVIGFAAGGHLAGGGQLPSAAILAALFAVTLVPVAALTRFRLSGPALAALLGAGQLWLHWALDALGGAGPAEAESAALMPGPCRPHGCFASHNSRRAGRRRVGSRRKRPFRGIRRRHVRRARRGHAVHRSPAGPRGMRAVSACLLAGAACPTARTSSYPSRPRPCAFSNSRHPPAHSRRCPAAKPPRAAGAFGRLDGFLSERADPLRTVPLSRQGRRRRAATCPCRLDGARAPD
jgi:hypothetical protein